MGFKDHFSHNSQAYASFRPTYPSTLFQWIQDICSDRQRVLDVAAGNGQATLELCDLFEEVVAIDASKSQIDQLPCRPNLSKSCAPAEKTGQPDQYFSAVTVAQALHWFQMPTFFEEVARILKPKGFLMVWFYGYMNISDEINLVCDPFYYEILKPFWPPERAHVDQEYLSLGLPSWLEKGPKFTMSKTWTLDQLKGYVRTWSGVKNLMEKWGSNQLDAFERDLGLAWTQNAQLIEWPVYTYWGRP